MAKMNHVKHLLPKRLTAKETAQQNKNILPNSVPLPLTITVFLINLYTDLIKVFRVSAHFLGGP